MCTTKAQLLSYKRDIFSYIQVIMKESLLELRQDFISFFLLHVEEIFCALRNDPWLQESLSALGRRLGTFNPRSCSHRWVLQTKLN